MKGLIQELKEKQIIDKEEAQELQEKVQTSEKSEEEIILTAQELDVQEKSLFQMKSQLIDVPLKTEVNADKLGSMLTDMAELIPEDSAKHYNLVPINKTGKNHLEIGMVYPKDLKSKEALKFLARRGNFSYDVYLITPSIFEEILQQYQELRSGAGAALGAIQDEEEEEQKEGEELDIPETKEGVSEEDVEDLAEEAPIVKVVSTILKEAVESGVSDIHIEPGREELEVRFRIDGVLHSTMTLPMNIHKAVIARIKILSNLKIEEKRLPQDGRFFSNFSGKEIDFRVATMPTTLGEKVVLRVLDPEQGMMEVSELGMRQEIETVVKDGINKPTGMILATGPTGSGKTTTLYSLLRTLNTEKVNIVTLEDPVEYYIDGVNQSQVNHEIGYDFATGLRQILRQDPDIIMVGEIRDEETASLAVHAALTGHIVLSTLHTNNAVGVVPRLTEMGVKPYLVSPSLNTAIAQRLVRRLCDNCKKKKKPDPEIQKVIRQEINKLPSNSSAKKKVDLDNIVTYEPVGCDKCNGIGFSGRVGIFEALEMTNELSKIVLNDPTEKKLNEEAHKQGMVTMRQDGILKALDGLTSIEVVLKSTKESKGGNI